jgi:ribonuclease HI
MGMPIRTERAAARGIAIPPTGEAHAYADGACSGNPGLGGWASVIVAPDGDATFGSGGEALTTNNRMELRAAADAVTRGSALSGTTRLVVNVDSKYVIDGIGGWIRGWKRNGWRTSSGAEVKNKDLWQALDGAVASSRGMGVNVVFSWVKGHAGHPGNEAADAEACARVRDQRGQGRAVLTVAVLIVAAAAPALAQELPRPGPVPTVSTAPVTGGYVVDGGTKGDWGFEMGPIGSPGMRLKMIRANKDHSGAIGFACSRADGTMQLVVALPGAAFDLGKERDLDLSVSEKSAKLKVSVRNAPTAGQPPLFQASSPLAALEVLKAMAAVPETALSSNLRISDGAGHAVTFGLPRPHTVAGTAASVCSGWATAAADAAFAQSAKDQPNPFSRGSAPQAVPPPAPPSATSATRSVPTTGVHDPQ